MTLSRSSRPSVSDTVKLLEGLGHRCEPLRLEYDAQVKKPSAFEDELAETKAEKEEVQLTKTLLQAMTRDVLDTESIESGRFGYVRHQVDLAEARNLIIVSVTLVFGIGGMVFGYGEFSLSGISLCAIIALILNLVLPGGEGWKNKQLEENS